MDTDRPAVAELMADVSAALAQRVSVLRAYRVGHARFFGRLLNELAEQTNDAEMLSTTALSMSRVVAEHIDQTSEGIVLAYEQEKEDWLRKRSAAQAARVRDLLSGKRIDVSAAEATLGYRLRQRHVGLVCWVGAAVSAADEISRLERATGHVARQAACYGDPLFLACDESSAWAWLPVGIRDTFGSAAATACTADADIDVHFAFGDPAEGTAGFLSSHQQAIAAQAVALAAEPPGPRVTTFSEVAPVALMLESGELLRGWLQATLADLATDDEHHARLRDTLRVFLRSGGSYKTTAEQLMIHKNTVQYRIRKAQESLGRPLDENRLGVELALLAGHWLGPAVLRPAAGRRRPAADGRRGPGKPGGVRTNRSHSP